MTIVRTGILPGGTFRVPKPVITSTVLPNGTATVPYAFQFTATAQQGPLSWVILSNSDPTGNGLTLSSTGLLSGTPVNPETMNFTVQVLDFLGQAATAPISLTFAAFSPGVGLGPSFMWDGGTMSTIAAFSWWPPSDGTKPDSYNVYRNGVQIATGIVPKFYAGGSAASPSIGYPFYRDQGPLTPSTVYNYTVTCVTAGVESQPGPTYVTTTLAGNTTPTTPPTPPTDPATFFPAYQLPTGGTTWTPATGAALKTAFNSAQPGDVIVLQAGTTYTSTDTLNNSAFTMAGGSSGGWIYVVSSQDPGLGTSGQLPAYSVATSLRHTQFIATTAPLAGATSLTLATNFTGRTGWYKTVFNSSNPSGIETRQALYQNGSASVVWNVGLQANCLANFLAGIGNHVSPWDAGIPIGTGNVTNATPSMPTIQFTQAGSGGNGGTGLFVSGQNIRFVGINIQPLASFHSGGLVGACAQVTQTANNIIFDRCVMGRDNTVPTYTYFSRSLLTGGTNVVVHQSYLYGADNGPGGSDSQAINVSAKGPVCFQNNYMEAVSEIVMTGGGKVAQTAVAQDQTIRYNWTHKQTAWQLLRDSSNFSPSRRVKNHLELKMGIRVHWHGNVIQNNAALQASQGQGGKAFTLTPRDQISQPVNSHPIQSITWAAGIATVTVGSVPVTAGTNFTTTIANCPVAGYNGTFIGSAVNTTTWTFALPVNPGANAGAFTGYSYPPQAGGPWMNISDVDIHDNQVYGVGSMINIAGGIDYDPVLHMSRVWVHNNLAWINPAFTDDLGSTTLISGIFAEEYVPDVKVNNNTIVLVPHGFGYSATGAGQLGIGIDSIQATNLGFNQLNDRWTVTDNCIDGETGGTIQSTAAGTLPNVGAVGGKFVQFAYDPATVVFNKNLFFRDTSSGANAWPTGTFQALGNYASVGMANFVSNTAMPVSPSDYNVVSGTYATASTTGGPIGSIFSSFDPANLYVGIAFQGLTLTVEPGSQGTNNRWLDVVGTDGKYGVVTPQYSLPGHPAIWGGSEPQSDSIQQAYVSVGDITEAIITDNTVPSGVSNQVLLSTMVNPWNGSNPVIQDQHMIFPSTTLPQPMYYSSRWLWLQSDIFGARGGSNFLLTEFKTQDPGSERFGIELVPGANWGQPTQTAVFEVYHDSNSLFYLQTIMGATFVATGNNGTGQTYQAPVPLGRWWRLEFACNRSDSAGQGWLWIAITDPASTDPSLAAGVQVFAARGAFTHIDNGNTRTQGMNKVQTNATINRIYNHVVYGDIGRSPTNTYQVKMTDLKVYPNWPSDATAHPSNYL